MMSYDRRMLDCGYVPKKKSIKTDAIPKFDVMNLILMVLLVVVLILFFIR